MENANVISLLTKISLDLEKIAGLMEIQRPAVNGGKIEENDDELFIIRKYPSNKHNEKDFVLLPGWYSALDSEKILGKSRSTLDRYREKEVVRSKKVGCQWHYHLTDLLRVKCMK